MENKFIPLATALLGIATGYVLSNPLLFDTCFNTYQFNGVLGCGDNTVKGIGGPLLVFSMYSIVVTLGVLFFKKPFFKTWTHFSFWFVPLALLFIFALPVTSTGVFLQSPWLQYFRADAARDAGRAFILLSLVVVLLKFYQLRQVGYKKSKNELTNSAMTFLRKVGYGLWFVFIVFLLASWVLLAVLDVASGCPPPPFAHRCLMKQAGVLPPYNATEESHGSEELDQY